MTFTPLPSSGKTLSQRVIQPDEGVPRIDLRNVDWPKIPHYGWDHAKNVAQLCMAFCSEFELTEDQERVLWVAALLHDIGRKEDWSQPDPLHRVESARLAHEILKKDPDLWSDVGLREKACKLIGDHTLNREKSQVHDPLEKILWDAEIFESARFFPGTHEGLVLVKERMKKGLFSQWANNSKHLKRWMEFRKWPQEVTNTDKKIIT